MIFFISLEYESIFTIDIINGISMVSKGKNTYNLKLWIKDQSKIKIIENTILKALKKIMPELTLQMKSKFGNFL